MGNEPVVRMVIRYFSNYVAHLSEAGIKSGVSVILTGQSFEQTELAFCLHGCFNVSHLKLAKEHITKYI